MKMNVFGKWLAGLGLFTLLFSFSPQSHAIGIRPIRHEVNVDPGQTVEGSVVVVNETDSEFYAEPTLLSFYRNNEGGFPIFADEKNPELEDVTKWIEIDQEPVLVPAKSSKEVFYKVNVPENTTPGGKYVSIAYQPVKYNDEGVTVNVRAASLLFLNISGEIIQKGEVTDFNLPEQKNTEDPFSFNVTFENTGNTHVKPTGKIEIIDVETGEKLKKIARYIDPETNQEVVSDDIPVNLYKTNVLPNSDRIFNAYWNENVKEGHFKGVLELTYLKDQTPIQQEFEFNIEEKLIIKDFQIEVKEKEAKFKLTASNEGSGNQKLKGDIHITNSFNYEIAKIPLPQDMEALAAGETKTFEIDWLNKDVPTGRYTATLEAEYGYTKKPLKEEVKFGEADRLKMVLIIALIVVTLIALVSLFIRRKPKRRVVHRKRHVTHRKKTTKSHRSRSGF